MEEKNSNDSVHEEIKQLQTENKLHYLHEFRSEVFQPLYEIFICYGQEEFHDMPRNEKITNQSYEMLG